MQQGPELLGVFDRVVEDAVDLFQSVAFFNLEHASVQLLDLPRGSLVAGHAIDYFSHGWVPLDNLLHVMGSLGLSSFVHEAEKLGVVVGCLGLLKAS